MNAIAELPSPDYNGGIVDLGGVQIDLDARVLLRHGEVLPLGSRAFEILVVLAEANGRIVSKDELMSAVWPRVIVEENNIQVHLSSLRKVLGSDRDIIVTVPRRGFRLARHDMAPNTKAADLQANALPAPATVLIGRTLARERVKALFATSQVLTLVGAGGVGKSALALDIARGFLAQPVRYIDLARIYPTPHVHEWPGDAHFPALPKAAGGLLLIDNADHVIAHAAKFVEGIVAEDDQTRVLVTSREPLRIMAETVYRVEALDVPSTGASGPDALKHSAVQLFLSRGRAVQPNLGQDDAELACVGTICRRLEGNPLAIELAAARLAALGLEDIDQRLDDQMSLLAGGYRNAMPRHKTWRANFDWSYAQLNATEKAFFRRISVFTTAFSFEALCAIACDETVPIQHAIDCASELTAKSLLNVEFDEHLARYRLPESARAYASERLKADDDEGKIVARYVRYLAQQNDEK